MNFKRVILLISTMLSLSLAQDNDLANIFDKSKLNGTIVISALNDDVKYIYNNQRAVKGYIPASTFKIINTLIALEEEVIKDENEIIKWDGEIRSYSSWNKDQTLQSAISVSCIWCYQKFAKEIGNDKYLTYLKNINYGNHKTGSKVTTFWLDGDIEISAIEQIDFLKKLYKNELPFKQRYIDITKKILTVKKTENYIIKAKTGFSGKIGWYVGYVETKNGVWFFALNADVTKDTLKYRKQIVIESLKIKNII
ncbi:class D beta-lactamase [Sulfurimonas sp.]|uniref:class D beta-lactamase n=1 Tax=Sulfurimonas sp. TaxID=2022749 RepID=UPI002AB21E63|nr:class D beta-lactamase [Sulfurimonas sp.]